MAHLDRSLGDDVVVGTSTADLIHPGDGDDIVFAGNGNDIVDDGFSHPVVTQGPHGLIWHFNTGGDDVFYGQGGNDLLLGYSGDDTLSGGTGRDTLRGGSGADSLSGGSDRDTFDYNSVTESRGQSTDTITDFQNAGDAAGDRIDLGDLFPGTMTWRGVIPSSQIPTPAGSVYARASGSDTLILANTDTDAEAEWGVRITDGNTIDPFNYGPEDFILT